jgi:hypothetical protein
MKKRNSDISLRFPNYYNHELLQECLSKMKPRPSMRRVAADLKMPRHTVLRVFRGTATQKQAWPVASYFKVDWMTLHDLTPFLNRSHRATLTPVRGNRAVN